MMFRTLLILLLMMPLQGVFAHAYQARLDVAEWHLEPGPMSCRLWQSVPNYGDAVFETKAGQRQSFYIDTYRPVINGGTAAVSIKAPEWRTDVYPRDVGSTALKTGKRPIVLDEDRSNLLLAELEEGMQPSFRHVGWHKAQTLDVGVSPVNFPSAYAGYVACVAALFPASFEQLRNSTVHFEFDKFALTPTAQARLDLVAGLLQLDKSVQKIVLDGHTDAIGRKWYNYELSRRRAESVKKYLESKGVEASMIQMRYFGKAKPVKPNNTAANRAMNRRVYVQLIQG